MGSTRSDTPYGEKALSAFVSHIERYGSGRFRSHDTLRWFLATALARFGLKTSETPPADTQGDFLSLTDEYLALVRGAAPFTDILGPAYMLLASHGGRSILGQYFTPQSVADAMALMTLGDSPAPEEDGRLITVCDPTAGSGVMCLSMCRAVLRQGDPSALARYSVTLIDLDLYCAHMAAVQFLCNLAAHGLTLGEVVVYHGNSLLPEDGLRVVVHATAQAHSNTVLPAAAPLRCTMIRDAATAAGVGQLPLFGTDADGDKAA